MMLVLILITQQRNETRASYSTGAGFINVITIKLEKECL